MIKDSGDTSTHSHLRRSEIWAWYYCAAVTEGHPYVSANESVLIDTNPPSEMEVVKGLSFLRRYKAVEPEELSSSFFKGDGEKCQH